MEVSEVKKGMKVEIVTKQGKIARGFVEDVAAKASSLYGVVVRLKSGEIGNVKKIILGSEEMTKRDSSEIGKMIEKGENFYVEFKSSALWSANLSENDIKQSKSFDLHSFKQKTSKVIIAKSIASFLNSGGGSLIIGVKEKKENLSVPENKENTEADKNSDSNQDYKVIGIDDELKKLKDPNKDGYKRMIIDDVLRSFFPSWIYNHMNEYIWINFVDVQIAKDNLEHPKVLNQKEELSDVESENVKKIICWIKIKKCDTKVFLKVNDKEIFMIRTDTENRALEGERLVDYCMKRFGKN